MTFELILRPSSGLLVVACKQSPVSSHDAGATVRGDPSFTRLDPRFLEVNAFVVSFSLGDQIHALLALAFVSVGASYERCKPASGVLVKTALCVLRFFYMKVLL